MPYEKKVKAFYQPFGNIRTVAVLGKSEQLEELNLVAQDLKDEGKNVFVFLIVSLEDVEKTVGLKEKLSPDCHLIDPKGFSWKGALVGSGKNKFLETECDAVFDFTCDDVRFHQLMLSHPCPFRVGIVSCDYPLYDFCILKDNAQGLTEVYQQIKKYLSSIRQAQ